MGLWNSIKDFARRPHDSDETSFIKALVLVVALSCCGCGLVWSALYTAVFGLGLTMALPLAFVVIVGTAIILSVRISDHRPVIYAQLTCITWISALIQWSIGSSVDSGLVICWSFLRAHRSPDVPISTPSYVVDGNVCGYHRYIIRIRACPSGIPVTRF